MEHLTTLQLSVQSGVSPRQLQHWDESGLVSPRMEGHRRLYDSADVAIVKLIAAFRQKRMSLQVLRRALGRLPDQLPDSAAFALTDGLKIRFANDRDEAFDLMQKARRPVVMVSIPRDS